MSVHIQIEKFEGPIALLLHLIRKEEMDIFDINIYQITQQYLEYIKTMKKLNLEVAGDFIAMASTLIQIKSRMLLPQYNDEGEIIEGEDPRKELVQKLLEYQAIQDVSKRLYERPLLGRDIWLRGVREKIECDKEEEIITEENALFSLIVAYRKAIKNMKKSVHKVGADLQSIAERVRELRNILVAGAKIRFSTLIDKEPGEARANQVLVTFLSMLELAKMGFVRVFQSENFGEIHIEAEASVGEDALARVEEYDTPAENKGLSEIFLSEEEQEENAQMDLTANSGEVNLNEEFESADGSAAEGVQAESAMDDNDFSISEEDIDAATDDEILEEERRLDLMESNSDLTIVEGETPQSLEPKEIPEIQLDLQKEPVKEPGLDGEV